MKMRKCLSVLFALVILLGSMPVLAAETGAGESKLPDGIISMDLTERVPVSEIPQQTAVTREVVSQDAAVPRITYPDMSIIAIIGNPYAIEKTTGKLYFFPDFKVGHEISATEPPFTNLVVNYSVANTQVFEHVLESYGYELCGWRITMVFRLETIYIPKFLEVNVRDIQKPIVPLSSNDKGQTLGYHFDFEIAPGDQPYEGIIKGNLVCMNLDTSAVLFPYRTGITFNQ